MIENVVEPNQFARSEIMFDRLFHKLVITVSLMLTGLYSSAVFADGICTLQEHGKEVTISNGIITAQINVAGAAISSIKYAGHEMVSTTGRHKEIYFSRDGGATYENPSHCVGKVTTQSADVVDYSCKHVYTPAAGDKAAWDIDVHFAVKRGVPGVYVYTENAHPASYPDLGVGEWRMVWSPAEDSKDFLDTIYVDEARHWTIPSPGDFASAQAVPGAAQGSEFTDDRHLERAYGLQIHVRCQLLADRYLGICKQ